VEHEQAQNRAANAQWDSRSVGKRWQLAFFGTLIRLFGRRPAYLCMYFVVAWYVLFSPLVRRRCRPYLDRRFPQVGNPFTRLWYCYRRVVALGKSLIDRGTFGILGPAAIQIRFPEGPRLRALTEESKGLIVLNSHVGSWQVAMSAFSFMKVPVSIVMHQGAADIDPRWFSGQEGKVPFQIVDPAQPMGGVMQMIQALKEKQILGMMADRIFGEDPNTLAVPFLGEPVSFPVSPYRLASMQGTPIAVVFSCKTGYRTYDIKIARIIRVPQGLGRKNEAYTPYVEEFVGALEEFVGAYPWQFFNFHTMWEGCPADETGMS